MVDRSDIRKGLKYPKQAIDKTISEAFLRVPLTYLNTKTTIGTNVFCRDWDVLILLDTCRIDALREVAPEYDFLTTIGSMRSVGGRSPEWIAKTFTKPYEDTIRETAYLSANVFSRQVLQERQHESISKKDSSLSYRLLSHIPTVDVSDIGHFEYLYEYEPVGEDGPLGHIDGGTPPRYITDRGIQVGREYDFDRIILHYLQPHPPYMANAIRKNRELEKYERDWWGYLGDTGDYETVWNAYLDELRFVLDDVELLLENIEAEKVAISSDHGEAFGEYWEFGHNNGSMNPKVRNVPWVETSGTDTNSFIPSIDPPTMTKPMNDIESQLAALGYKN